MFNKSRTVDAAPKNFKIDKTLEYTENFKILGLTMNSNLKWYDHITAMVKKAYKKIWMLVRMKLNQVPTKDLLLMYKLTSTEVQYPRPFEIDRIMAIKKIMAILKIGGRGRG